MASRDAILSIVEHSIDQDRFRNQHWEGTLDDYLQVVADNPRLARNAFQRIYDMIMHFGSERYSCLKHDFVRYKFFSDPLDNGQDAIFGLDGTLMQLVDFFKSAACGYGTDRRILLLHGPVGSSKSTITRLLKKGIEYYSRLDEGRCTASHGGCRTSRDGRRSFHARCMRSRSSSFPPRPARPSWPS